jgi:hypothetical protein
MSEQHSQPLRPLPVAPGSSPAPPRHETVIPDEPGEAVAALEAALASTDVAAALRDVVAGGPSCLDGWARLGQQAWRDGEHPVIAYACARVDYHRGLDRLRRHNWGGTGMVRWSQPGNRGFLRALHLLLVAAAAIGEEDEAARCREFLLELDSEDGLDAAAIPQRPGRDWRPELLP